MTSTTLPNLSSGRSSQQSTIPTHWAWSAVLLALFALYFQSYLTRMFRIATNTQGETLFERIYDLATTPWNHDWSHAIVVPFISGYFIYNSWHQISQAAVRVYRPALFVLLFGMFGFVWWIYPGRNDMFQGYCMIIALFGLAMFLFGPSVMRIAWFPILYLALGIKIADRLWEHLAWKLQIIAAHSATVVLQLVGINASVEGSTISLVFMRKGQWASEALNVAEACSGLRMLMAFVALGLAMAYLTSRRWWQRIIIFSLTIPIAVMVNVGRVTVLGILYLFDKEFASGDVHTFIGMLMLIPAGLLFLMISWILDRIIIREPDPNSDHVSSNQPEQQADDSKPNKTLESAIGTTNGQDWMWSRSVTGLLIGAALMCLAGAGYGLLLASLRPDILDQSLSRPLLLTGLAVTSALIIGTSIYAWRTLGRETVPNRAHREFSMGLAAGILAAGILGLNAIVSATETVLIKHAIPLSNQLYQIPDQLGEWSMIREDPPMSAEGVEALGTDKYLTRVYKAPSIDGTGRDRLVRLHIAYYTGTPDTVPHVPDRCFVAGGLQPIETLSTLVTLSGPQYRTDDYRFMASSKLRPQGVLVPESEYDVTRFTYALPTQLNKQSHVMYFFVANGKFLSTPDLVRLYGFDPRDRYSYYCKVEVGVVGATEVTKAVDTVSSFLSAAMPEIMACLPDWEQAVSGPITASSDATQSVNPIE